MKVIQSYIPFNNHNNPNSIISKEYAYLALLSGLQLKKLYGRVTLYTNEYLAEHFAAMDFPHEYDLSLNKEKAVYFATAKLKAFADQKEPFIHYDLDTLVFQKPDFSVKKSPFIFSHPDMPNHGYYKKDRVVPRKKHKAINALVQDVWFDNLMESYLLAYYNTSYLPEDYPIHLINPNNIPNMNIIGVKDWETFNKATNLAIEIADKNEKIFANNWLASNFIEQLTIPLYLELMSEEYRSALAGHKQGDPALSPFLFNGDPFTCLGFSSDDKNHMDQVKNMPKYPFDFKHFYHCGECHDWHKKMIPITDDNDFIDQMDLTKHRFTHIGGTNKQFALWQAMIIHTLVKHYGEETILKVTNRYKMLGEKENNSNQYYHVGTYSHGEDLYEKLTGNKIFSQTSLKGKNKLL
jgi:hypothetical protein